MSEESGFVKTVDEAGLVRIAGQLANTVGEGGVIHLVGPLGAGKTTFARALLTALGVGSRVKSPTYSLIESYAVGALGIQHLDLYRIADPEEIEWLGLRDFADPQLWLIEWPERAHGAIPAADLVVRLAHADAARDIRLQTLTERARRWLAGLALSETS
ncbi:MAG: tRNA (adenosine(37)-N6)-threonylcarbamoyltransferase complex ATPase subunit type 1 TsaE [Rudaea sp.]